MKRAIVTALAIVLLALGTFLVITQLPTAAPPPSAEPNAPASVALTTPADAMLSHVAYVYDGDTLYLQPDGTTSRDDQITVRVIGVDTPELRPSIQCFATEARDYLRTLLPVGAEVWITADVEPLDQYGRSLYYLWTADGDFVNLDLVANGYATALRVKPNEEYWPEFRDAETAARADKLGQWASC